MEYHIDSSGNFNFKLPKKIHPIVYSLIVNRYATLKEIKYEYTIEEVIELYEILKCKEYNTKDYLDNR